MIDILDHAKSVARPGEAKAVEIHVIEIGYGVKNQRVRVDIKYSVELCGQKFVRGEPIICLFGYPVLRRSVGIELVGKADGMDIEAAVSDEWAMYKSNFGQSSARTSEWSITDSGRI